MGAYEKFLNDGDGEDAKKKRFLFYSAEQRRWQVRDVLEDAKLCFAFCKVKKEKATTPAEIPGAKAWNVYDGKDKGHNEDENVHCKSVKKGTRKAFTIQ